MAILEESPLNSGGYDYKFAAAEQSPERLSFAQDESQAVITIRVGSDKLLTVSRDVLGYTLPAVDGTTYTLRRQLPWQHPWLPSMRAARILDLHQRGYPDAPVDLGYGRFSYYTSADGYPVELTVLFQTPQYDVLTDSATTFEYERFVTRTATPAVEFLQDPFGRLTFAETIPAATEVVAGSTVVQTGTNARVVRTELKLVWHQVPEAALFDGYSLRENLTGLLGKVNRGAFLGYPAGTLLCEGLRPVPHTMPVDRDYIPDLTTTRQYDLEITLSHFDPPTSNATTSGTRGWNLLPVRKRPDLWLLATYDGATTGRRLYEEGDFGYLFAPWANVAP